MGLPLGHVQDGVPRLGGQGGTEPHPSFCGEAWPDRLRASAREAEGPRSCPRAGLVVAFLHSPPCLRVRNVCPDLLAGSAPSLACPWLSPPAALCRLWAWALQGQPLLEGQRKEGGRAGLPWVRSSVHTHKAPTWADAAQDSGLR